MLMTSRMCINPDNPITEGGSLFVSNDPANRTAGITLVYMLYRCRDGNEEALNSGVFC